MEKKLTPPLTPGLIISLILIVFITCNIFTSLYTATWSQYIGFAILLGGIIWAVNNHGKETGNNVGFGTLFGYGFKSSCNNYLPYDCLYSFVGIYFPEIKEKIISVAKRAGPEPAKCQPGPDRKGNGNVRKELYVIYSTWHIILVPAYQRYCFC